MSCSRGTSWGGPVCIEGLERRVLLSGSFPDFSTADEFDDVLALEPSRVVVQWIDNVFHRWSEYDLEGSGFGVQGTGGMAIVLEAPEHRLLSAAEAEDLFYRSGGWMEQHVALSGLDWSEQEIEDVPPDEPFIVDPGPMAETVIGEDDRVRITDVESYPWNTVGYVQNRYPGGTAFRGTGFLVGPHVALTNMHMIYNEERGGFVTQVNMAPGQLQTVTGGSVTRPYGYHQATSWGFNQAYIDAGTGYGTAHIENDYAALFFDQDFSSLGITTYMPLVFNQSPSHIHVSGYPSQAHGQGTSAQWYSNDSVMSVFSRYITYTADTAGGNSGGPVWEEVNGVRRVVAIHSFGATNHNGGPRLVTANQSLIEGWMQWIPGLEADRFEPNETAGMATDLGVVQTVRSEPGLSIHTTTDVDWFRFELVHPGSAGSRAEVLFSHSMGNLDAVLYDSELALVTTASSTTDNETISLSGLPAGEYYLRVGGASGAMNVYDLELTGPGLGPDRFETNNTSGTATDFGRVFFERLEEQLTIHNGSDVDWFRFELVRSGEASSGVEVLFTHSDGDLDAALYDASMNQVGGSFSGSDNETISLSGMPAGVYYLRVSGFSGATNSYDLRIVPPGLVADRFEPNNSNTAAWDLGPVATELFEENLTIHTSSDVDWYRFELGNTGNSGNLVEILFDHELGDLDLQLFNNPNASALRASYSVTDNELIPLNGLSAGTYYLRVYGFSGARNLYDLRIVPPPPAPLTVTAGEFHWNAAPHTATVQFSRDVAGSLTAERFAIEDQSSGSEVSPATWNFGYDAATRSGTVTFNPDGGGLIPDGVYRLTVDSAGLVDVFGGEMAEDYSFDFFYLAGDANRDGRVDIGDLGILAGNWQSAASGPAEGDFNYSGTVEIADLGILAGNWQVDLDLASFGLGMEAGVGEEGVTVEAEAVAADPDEVVVNRGQARRGEVSRAWLDPQALSGAHPGQWRDHRGRLFRDGGSLLDLKEGDGDEILVWKMAESVVA